LPSQIHNQKYSQRCKKGLEKKSAKQVQKVKNIFTSISQEKLPEPKIVENTQTGEGKPLGNSGRSDAYEIRGFTENAYVIVYFLSVNILAALLLLDKLLYR
jgi:hypothetical protein